MKPTSFPVLISILAEQHHEGALLRMSLESGVPQSTLWRWLRALPRQYNPDLIRRLCEHYDLKFVDVWDLVQKDEVARLAGKKVTMPDLSTIRRGPVPMNERRRKVRLVMPIFAGAMLAGALAVQPAAAQVGSATTTSAESTYYVKRPGARGAKTPIRRRGRGFPYKKAA